MNALTDKTLVVVSKLGDYWVNPKQAEVIRVTLESSPTSSIDFDGTIVRCAAIDGILKPDDYETLNLKRRGAWQCKWKKWHERHQQCAHGQGF